MRRYQRRTVWIKTHFKAAVTVSAAVVLFCGACGDGKPGDERAYPPTSASGKSSNTAPTVANPLDVTKIEKSPCLMFPANALKVAGITPTNEGYADTLSRLGPACRLDGDTEHWRLSATLLTSDKQGLSRIYANQEANPNPNFKEVAPIEGYPAVQGVGTNSPSEGGCNVTVGLRDDLTLSVRVTGKQDRPCEFANTAAAVAVRAIKAAQ